MKILPFQIRQNYPHSYIKMYPLHKLKLAMKSGKGVKIIELRSIIYCKANGNYTELHLMGGKKIITSKTLKRIAEVMPNHFIRIHQSYLVNFHMVTAINDYMKLGEEITLPISRSYKKQVNTYYKRNITFI